MKDMSSHPIFWDGPKRAKFIRDVFEWQGSNSKVSNQLQNATYKVTQHKDWSRMLGRCFHNYAFPTDPKKEDPIYNPNNLLGLLRLFRNTSAHFEQIPGNVKVSG